MTDFTITREDVAAGNIKHIMYNERVKLNQSLEKGETTGGRAVMFSQESGLMLQQRKLDRPFEDNKQDASHGVSATADLAKQAQNRPKN